LWDLWEVLLAGERLYTVISMKRKTPTVFLRLCDGCCDKAGTVKELIKTGGCTCDICGWSCKCCGDDARQFVNRIPVNVIGEEGWECLQSRNRDSLSPLNWEVLFMMGRE